MTIEVPEWLAALTGIGILLVFAWIVLLGADTAPEDSITEIRESETLGGNLGDRYESQIVLENSTRIKYVAFYPSTACQMVNENCTERIDPGYKVVEAALSTNDFASMNATEGSWAKRHVPSDQLCFRAGPEVVPCAEQ